MSSLFYVGVVLDFTDFQSVQRTITGSFIILPTATVSIGEVKIYLKKVPAATFSNSDKADLSDTLLIHTEPAQTVTASTPFTLSWDLLQVNLRQYWPDFQSTDTRTLGRYIRLIISYESGTNWAAFTNTATSFYATTTSFIEDSVTGKSGPWQSMSRVDLCPVCGLTTLRETWVYSGWHFRLTCPSCADPRDPLIDRKPIEGETPWGINEEDSH
jgi:hypothetical protein